MKLAWSPKDPSETYPVAFDFSAVVPSTETISSSTWTATVVSGNDASPSAILYGSPVITGTTVKQVVTGGYSGVTYSLKASITTSGGSTYLGVALLPVQTQTA